jgi:hypothetical protein
MPVGELDRILQAFSSLKVLEEVKKANGASFDHFLARLRRYIGREFYELSYQEFTSLYSDRVIYEPNEIGGSRKALRAENLYLGLLETAVLAGAVLSETVIAALPAAPECAAIRQLQAENQERQRILREFSGLSSAGLSEAETGNAEVNLNPLLASSSEAVHVELERLMVEVNIYRLRRSGEALERVRQTGKQIQEITYKEFLGLFPEKAVCRYDKNGLLLSISDLAWVYVGEVALAFLDGKPVATEIVSSLPITAAGGETIRRLIQAYEGEPAGFSL